MATKSDNTKGNPYHSEADGKFVSAEDASQAGGKTPSATPAAPKIGMEAKKLGVEAKSGLASRMAERLKDINQLASTPRLFSANDIMESIPRFFSNTVVKNVVDRFGKVPNQNEWMFETDDGHALPIWPCVLGKNRFRDNHASFISVDEYRRLSGMHGKGVEKVFRGITSPVDKKRGGYVTNGWTGLADSYTKMGVGNVGIYGGGMYGTNVYTTVDYHYALSYDGGYNYGSGYRDEWRGHMLKGILDEREAYYVDEGTLRSIQHRITNDISMSSAMREKVRKAILASTGDESMASKLSGSFMTALSKDIGLVGILMGVDYFVSDGHQRNILNLSRWKIAKDWQ